MLMLNLAKVPALIVLSDGSTVTDIVVCDVVSELVCVVDWTVDVVFAEVVLVTDAVAPTVKELSTVRY